MCLRCSLVYLLVVLGEEVIMRMSVFRLFVISEVIRIVSFMFLSCLFVKVVELIKIDMVKLIFVNNFVLMICVYEILGESFVSFRCMFK